MIYVFTLMNVLFFILLRIFVFIWVTEINLNPREHGVTKLKKKFFEDLSF